MLEEAPHAPARASVGQRAGLREVAEYTTAAAPGVSGRKGVGVALMRSVMRNAPGSRFPRSRFPRRRSRKPELLSCTPGRRLFGGQVAQLCGDRHGAHAVHVSRRPLEGEPPLLRPSSPSKVAERTPHSRCPRLEPKRGNERRNCTSLMSHHMICLTPAARDDEARDAREARPGCRRVPPSSADLQQTGRRCRESSAPVRQSYRRLPGVLTLRPIEYSLRPAGLPGPQPSRHPVSGLSNSAHLGDTADE